MPITQEMPVLITCPNAHEWWVKVATEKPPQPQRVVCPVCDEPHEVLLPSIVKIEVL